MANIFVRNNALDVHPPLGQKQLTENGSNWLFAVTAIFLLVFLIFFVISSILSTGRRAFYHYIFTIILLVAAITYFAEASDLGWRLVRQVNHDRPQNRQVFYPKFIRWAVAFAGLIIVQSGDRAVQPTEHHVMPHTTDHSHGINTFSVIFYEIGLAWIFVGSLLVASYVQSNYKWGFYAFGTFALLILIIGSLRHAATAKDKRTHAVSNAWISILWLMYPIAWALADGGNRIGVTGGYIWYGILDILLICGTAMMYMFRSRGSPREKTVGTV